MEREVTLDDEVGLTDEPVGDSRAVTATAHVAVATVMAMPVGVGLGYAPGWEGASTDAERAEAIRHVSPRWTLQWWTLLRARRAVEECYAGHGGGNVLAVHSVELGCLASQWLEEHLEADGAPASAWRTKRDLQDAHDLANTHKHAGRKPEKRVGRVLSYEAAPGGHPTITLAFVEQGSDVVQLRDALELLRSCERAWQDLITKHVGPPPPLP